MEEVVEVKVSARPRETQSSLQGISTPSEDGVKSPFATRFLSTPLASPMKKAIENMQGYLGEVGRFTKLDPQDDWLPITESRKGNAYYAAFHVLSSGIGFQALVLPLAFTTLGWTWGVICLCVAFTWQLYTLWLLIQLHESDSGLRHSRYLRLAMAAFGAITAVSYCVLICIVSVVPGRLHHVSYEPRRGHSESEASMILSAWNALGIIAFAFRGHNLVLEIQGTMPSDAKQPSRLAMWKGVMFAYIVIALCLFPLAIGGYWAYGNLIPTNGGMLGALQKYHEHDTSKFIIALISLLVVINSLSSFQIYAMPVFDNLEFRYTSKMNRPCPRWLRIAFRGLFGCLAFFIAVALPFLPSLAGLIGGVALPITLAYPCFMWIQIKKPQKCSTNLYINWTLGVVGMILSVLVVIGAIWGIVAQGIEIHFFNPR
ncbi:hypothetical protein JHK87_014031 [Glycine soja]|nr:hypothetical protein JHK87_014031 [Glycine soja]